jgi:hypothetical protein
MCGAGSSCVALANDGVGKEVNLGFTRIRTRCGRNQLIHPNAHNPGGATLCGAVSPAPAKSDDLPNPTGCEAATERGCVVLDQPQQALARPTVLEDFRGVLRGRVAAAAHRAALRRAAVGLRHSRAPFNCMVRLSAGEPQPDSALTELPPNFALTWATGARKDEPRTA